MMTLRGLHLEAELEAERAKVTALKKELEEAGVAMRTAVKACYCHRNKGFDYREKHPTMGVCPSGRWLSPKELLTMALLRLQVFIETK